MQATPKLNPFFDGIGVLSIACGEISEIDYRRRAPRRRVAQHRRADRPPSRTIDYRRRLPQRGAHQLGRALHLRRRCVVASDAARTGSPCLRHGVHSAPIRQQRSCRRSRNEWECREVSASCARGSINLRRANRLAAPARARGLRRRRARAAAAAGAGAGARARGGRALRAVVHGGAHPRGALLRVGGLPWKGGGCAAPVR
jgi:hypothetical protein